jgi:phenylalanyl-tRNA synthetase alpha chain
MTVESPDLKEIEREAEGLLEQCHTPRELEEARVRLLGRKGLITAVMRELGKLPPEARPAVGKRANLLRKKIEQALAEKKLLTLEARKVGETVFDYTLPGRTPWLGRPHPITQTIVEIEDIFRGMGFEVAEGPHIETDYYNFDALNTPQDHPSRDLSDTLYLDKGILLRTHTSPVQIRVMERKTPPVRIIAPGLCFRRDTPDASHTPNFFQTEGLYVDKDVTVADLKGVITAFATELFGAAVKVRFRPHFFPFTEPSVEYDFSCMICEGEGCAVCKRSGWVEISGAGMVDPEVFKAVGYDPEVYSGYAFGMGVDRIAMIKYRITDIRMLYENDLRFLRQF